MGYTWSRSMEGELRKTGFRAAGRWFFVRVRWLRTGGFKGFLRKRRL